MTRLHSKIGVVKRVQAEVVSSGRDVEKTAVSLTDLSNMRDEAAERTSDGNAQLAASVFREDACKSELTPMKEDVIKTSAEHANQQRSVSDLTSKMCHAFASLGGAL